MNNTPLISVVMSVYNSEKYLEEAMDSILTQTYTNFEFIIINDGSTDRSLEIILDYMNNDERIILISRDNRGLPYSLNEGVVKAKGEYIARMDADDISMPTRFEMQVDFMKKNRHIGICGTTVIEFGEDIKESLWKLSTKSSALKTQLLFSSCFAHPSVMIRKEVMLQNTLFYNQEFFQSQDFELWTRMAEYTKFANLSTPLLKYRIVDNSASREANKDTLKRYKVIASITDRLLQKLDIQLSEEEKYTHFLLSANVHMQRESISFDTLSRYFSKILDANENKNVYDAIELKKVLGKKWLWNIIYRKNIKACFSSYTFYGIWSLLSK